MPRPEEITSDTMGDYYTEDPRRLEGQPKFTIGSYVAQTHPTARRFRTLAEGRKSKRGLLIRSEHPQEYDGVSGLLDSYPLSHVLNRGSRDVNEIKRRYFEDHRIPSHARHCELLGLDLKEFQDEYSFSVWERLKGYNRTVVADSAVPDRWHIMTTYKGGLEGFASYIVFDNGEVLRLLDFFYNDILEDDGSVEPFTDRIKGELTDGVTDLVEFYESIRRLDRFDPNHCPIIEIQTIGKRNYFLQYHRTRDFEPADFILDRDPMPGEIEVPFVRGKTPKEGERCRVTACYGKIKTLLEKEDGSCDIRSDWEFSKLMFPRRTLQMKHFYDEGLRGVLLVITTDHGPRSALFKPRVSVIHGMNDMIPKEELDEIKRMAKETGEHQYIYVDVVSDGRRAFIKRV